MGTRARLSAMMALAYGVQGAFWPTLTMHLQGLGIAPRGRSWIFASQALAALIAPPIAGRIADRWFPAQKILAAIYALGTLFLVAAALGLVEGFAGLFALFVVYWVITIPFAGLVNTVAMRNVADTEASFGAIRLWGTVGWMVVGGVVSTMIALTGRTTAMFWVAAVLSVAMAAVCRTLPDTPPLATRSRGLPWREAMSLARRPGILVLIVSGFVACLTTPFVYQAVPPYLRAAGLSLPGVAAALSLGQVLEISSLAVLPAVLRRLGWRWTMTLGLATWFAYYGLFAARVGLPWCLLVLMLNGPAIALFHVAAPMYLDANAPPEHRAGAQGLWVVVTSGVGTLAGGLLAGEVMDRFATNWTATFAVPAGIALVLTAGFAATFGRTPAREGTLEVEADRRDPGSPGPHLDLRPAEERPGVAAAASA